MSSWVYATLDEIKELNYGTSSKLDFIIECDNHSWKVHSNILSASSKFFQSICRGNWQSLNRTVVLEDENHLTICHFIMWMYRGQGGFDTRPFDHSSFTRETWDLNTNVCVINQCRNAGYTDQESVQAAEENRKEDQDNAIPLYLFADKYDIRDLKVVALGWLDSSIARKMCFLNVTESWTEFLQLRAEFPPLMLENDSSLREHLAKAVAYYVFDENLEIPNEDVRKMLTNDGDFAVKVLERQCIELLDAKDQIRDLERQKDGFQAILHEAQKKFEELSSEYE